MLPPPRQAQRGEEHLASMIEAPKADRACGPAEPYPVRESRGYPTTFDQPVRVTTRILRDDAARAADPAISSMAVDTINPMTPTPVLARTFPSTSAPVSANSPRPKKIPRQTNRSSSLHGIRRSVSLTGTCPDPGTRRRTGALVQRCPWRTLSSRIRSRVRRGGVCYPVARAVVSGRRWLGNAERRSSDRLGTAIDRAGAGTHRDTHGACRIGGGVGGRVHDVARGVGGRVHGVRSRWRRRPCSRRCPWCRRPCS